MNELQEAVNAIGGTISGEFSDGRQFAPYLNKRHDDKIVEIHKKIKDIFDPFNMLNPGVKIGTSQSQLLEILRQNYDQSRFAEYNLRG